jgi:hypothetical protein
MTHPSTRSGARMVLLILVAAALSVAWALASVRTAHAEISGRCEATLNSVDVRGVSSGNRDNDIKVSEHSRVPIVMTSPQGFRSHKIQLEFADRRWTVSDKTDDGSNTFTDSVNVDDYATYGVGLYKIVGVATLSDGTKCTGAATVDVSGNPLATVAGVVAAGTVVVGTVGAVASGGLAAGSLGSAGNAAADAFAAEESARAASPDPYRYSYAYRPRVDWPWSMLGCFFALPMLLLTLPFMAVTGGAGGPPPEPARELPRFPRMRWMPRLTLLGVVSGLLAGLGGAVLLQQYAIDYPTQSAIIRDLVAGAVVYGLIIPTLGRTIAVLRFNGRISALERTRSAR